MPLVTRTVAKGIPPKVREPKRKGKLTTKKNQKGKTNKNGKRPAASEEDEDLESSSEESELPPKKKRNKKQQLNGVEVLEDEPEVEPPEENIEVINVDASPGSDDEEVSTILFIHIQILTRLQDDGLNEHHRGTELQAKPTKKDSTLDLLTMMSDRVTVKFMLADGTSLTEVGRWCNPCK
jgi:hypothetical protein